MNLPNRFNDVIDGAAVGQEQVLRHSHRRLANQFVAFQFLQTVAIGLQPLGAEEAPEAARGNRLIEQAVKILFRINAVTRNTFGFEGLDECGERQSVKLLLIVAESIKMPDSGCFPASAPAGYRGSA